MSRRYAHMLTMVPLVTLALSAVLAGAAAPGNSPGGLAGAWQVTRTCTSGCQGTTVATEVVRLHGGNVYMATGAQTLVLYQLGAQVLVHGRTASSLLTIKMPGQVMAGSSVAENGSTFKTAWLCVAASSASGYVQSAGATREQPAIKRARC